MHRSIFDNSFVLFDSGQVFASGGGREAFTHLDLKSDNAMVAREGRVKVLDFSPARQVEAAQRRRHAYPGGMLICTVARMSPEQARAQPTDAGRHSRFLCITPCTCGDSGPP